jgi:hypothetical protein
MIEIPPDLVQYNLAGIAKRRGIIYEQVFLPACDAMVTPDAFEALMLRLGARIRASREALVESLRYLAGSVLQRRDAMATAWRIAARWDDLRRGIPVRPWTSQHADEWVPVEILRGDLVMTRKKERAMEFSVCILGGTPCGLKTTVTWTNRVCFMLARRLGYSRRGGKFAYTKPQDLVGLRFYGQAMAARSTDRPYIRNVFCPPGIIAWNRKTVLRLRCRCGVQCPHGWRHACNQCAIGYEECIGATHFKTYVARHCPVCDDANAPFDPERRSSLCVRCTDAAVLRGGTR